MYCDVLTLFDSEEYNNALDEKVDKLEEKNDSLDSATLEER